MNPTYENLNSKGLKVNAPFFYRFSPKLTLIQVGSTIKFISYKICDLKLIKKINYFIVINI